MDDVQDGLAHTLFVGEKLSDDQDFGWMSGTRSTLRNTGFPINVDPWKPKRRGTLSKRQMAILEAREATYADGYSVDDFGGRYGDYDTDEIIDEMAVGSESEGDEAPDSTPVEDTVKDTPVVKEATDAGSRPMAIPTKTPLSVGGFGSRHGGGAIVIFGDGRVQFLSASISLPVYQELGNRSDGKLLDPSDYRE